MWSTMSFKRHKKMLLLFLVFVLLLLFMLTLLLLFVLINATVINLLWSMFYEWIFHIYLWPQIQGHRERRVGRAVLSGPGFIFVFILLIDTFLVLATKGTLVISYVRMNSVIVLHHLNIWTLGFLSRPAFTNCSVAQHRSF